MNNIIVIPVYKPHMSVDELRSLHQCIKILSEHDVALVCPEHLDTTQYETVFQQYDKPVTIARFNDAYFDCLDSYSKLCLSANFYKRFEKYKYMLIYQLDCWVFDDRLRYWCDMGYDYIGAPWSQKHLELFGMKKHPVGNGGLSLRKIETMIKLCAFPINQQTVIIPIPFHAFYARRKKKRIISNILNFPIMYIKYMTQRNCQHSKNEDVVIASYANKYIPEFSFPDAFTAAHFSIETAPEYFYKKVGHLPFGTHAWNKVEHRQFWNQFIKV